MSRADWRDERDDDPTSYWDPTANTMRPRPTETEEREGPRA